MDVKRRDEMFIIGRVLTLMVLRLARRKGTYTVVDAALAE